MVIFYLHHSYISQDSMVRFSSSLFNYLSILLVGRTNELLFYSFTLHLLSLASGNPFQLTSGPLTCPQHF